MASRVPAGLALPKCAVFRLLRDFRNRHDQPREDGEPALTPTGFGAPGLPETFLRNGEGRRTQTAGQRKQQHCMERMPQRSLQSSRIRACEAIRLCYMARLLRMDMVVDGKVIIENKAREPLDPNAQGQLFAGLAATNLEVGLVLLWKESALLPRILRESVQAP